MGKGTITGGGDNGLYNVKIEHDKTVATAEKTRITARMSALIIEMSTTPDNLSDLRAEYSSLSARLKLLNREVIEISDNDQQVWCADLTENISGAVGLAEIAIDENEGINILPGYFGEEGYNQTRDGVMLKACAMPPVSAYYNWVVFPGTQKWRPLYRYAQILTIDYDLDTCKIGVETVTSRAQGLNVNQTDMLTIDNVPIEYMFCNALAFKTSDYVLVRFEGQTLENPKVIGFKDNPQPCGLLFQLECECKPEQLFDIDNTEFFVKNSNQSTIPFELEWSEDKEAFLVMPDSEYLDQNGYFISYKSDDCAGTLVQYPSIITLADFYKPENLVLPDKDIYQDVMPCGLLFQLECECKPEQLFNLDNTDFFVKNSSLGTIPFDLQWSDNKDAFILIPDAQYIDNNGYFISYKSDDCEGKLTQYPGIVITNDFYNPAHLVLPKKDIYTDIMPCIWEHWKNDLCNKHDWVVTIFIYWKELTAEFYDVAEIYDSPCADPDEFSYKYAWDLWSGDGTVDWRFSITDSKMHFSMLPEPNLLDVQYTLYLVHDFTEPLQASGCMISLSDIDVVIPATDVPNGTSFLIDFVIFANGEWGRLRWVIFWQRIAPTATWEHHWEPKPLPEPDENGDVILNYNFGRDVSIHQITLQAVMLHSIHEYAGAKLDFKMDYIDFY